MGVNNHIGGLEENRVCASMDISPGPPPSYSKGIPSKSAKRRARADRSAIRKAQMANLEIVVERPALLSAVSLLPSSATLRADAPTFTPTVDRVIDELIAPVTANDPADATPADSSQDPTTDRKWSSSYSRIVTSALPAEYLAAQCASARGIQRAWALFQRKRRAEQSNAAKAIHCAWERFRHRRGTMSEKVSSSASVEEGTPSSPLPMCPVATADPIGPTLVAAKAELAARLEVLLDGVTEKEHRLETLTQLWHSILGEQTEAFRACLTPTGKAALAEVASDVRIAADAFAEVELQHGRSATAANPSAANVVRIMLFCCKVLEAEAGLSAERSLPAIERDSDEDMVTLHMRSSGAPFQVPKLGFLTKSDISEFAATTVSSVRAVDWYTVQCRHWATTGRWLTQISDVPCEESEEEEQSEEEVVYSENEER